jgi:hypothetical protein
VNPLANATRKAPLAERDGEQENEWAERFDEEKKWRSAIERKKMSSSKDEERRDENDGKVHHGKHPFQIAPRILEIFDHCSFVLFFSRLRCGGTGAKSSFVCAVGKKNFLVSKTTRQGQGVGSGECADLNQFFFFYFTLYFLTSCLSTKRKE